CIFLDRQKFDRAAAFAQRLLLSAQRSIDHPENAQRRCVFWFRLNNFLLLCPRCFKRGTRFLLIALQTGNKPFNEPVIEMDSMITDQCAFARCKQSSACGSDIAASQRAKQPAISKLLDHAGICRTNRSDYL